MPTVFALQGLERESDAAVLGSTAAHVLVDAVQAGLCCFYCLGGTWLGASQEVVDLLSCPRLRAPLASL